MTHVLIADDENHTRISLTFILESIGYLVTGAPDGREALDKILALKESSHPVDLLVLDIEMPGFTGWQLLDVLKEKNIILPTIIITGFSDNRTCGNVFKEWSVEYILKPFSPEVLTESISNVLGKKGPHEGSAKGEGCPMQRQS
jgi:two-component system response regulator FlrC